MDVVIVESPAKAKTINKYLGGNVKVLASYGHVRDLPAKDGSVRPDEDFAMTYQADPKSSKQLREIAQAVKQADALYLATDPDREGEAISWHVLEALKEKKAIGDIPVRRIVFNAITKSAVTDAMRNPRDLDMALVNAQQARRALDYLVGFTLSPVLWRKLPGARSAGRVQSVALRIICEREQEIEAFRPREYWSIDVDFQTPKNAMLTARLTHADGAKLDRYDIPDAEAAEGLKRRLESGSFRVAEVATKPASRNPKPPFITSTLQQEASRKLGFSATHTMRVAQRLYEGIEINGEAVGLITYMRTDGVQLAGEAIAAIRQVIDKDFGNDYLPQSPRVYKSKAKNAQEAHEAIRPTDPWRRPQAIRQALDTDQFKLYSLIWQRAVASQMESAKLERTTVDIISGDQAFTLRANGSVILHPGFLKLYEEGSDDNGDADEDRRLPKVTRDEALENTATKPEQHFTEPPPRFSEASLVKRLEELGIGRPSTYAAILGVLQDRGYVRLEKKRFLPEEKGRIVTAFLTSFFTRYVEYDFTAALEEQLDEISDRRIDWKQVLQDFWNDFKLAVDSTGELRTRDILEAVNQILEPHIFPAPEGGGDPRACPQCEDGRLSLKLGKFGAFVGCSNYPDCRHTRRLGESEEEAAPEGLENGPKLLGDDPETGLAITLRKGPYGIYLQLGEATDDAKPKRVSVPKDITAVSLDLAFALRLLSLPRRVGLHPETGKVINAGLGRFGPYLRYDTKYTKLDSTEDALSIGLNRAVDLIAAAKAKGGRPGAEPLKALGEHPDDGQPVNVMKGRYGPYVKHGKINATLPKDMDPDSVTMEQALPLLAERAAKTGKGKAKKPAAKKKKAAPKKTKAAAGASD